MGANELRGLLKARPFRPFALHRAEGASVSVWRPDLAMLSPLGDRLIVYQPDSACDLLDVPSVESHSFHAADAP
jgi:hypothetical protein